ncbi:kinase-like protein [Piromyces finnis]|uniref:Cyclin-dependent kinase 1 n=1 Tax=Piromyces finnis TaxID=1754191 RepID=A0A1Y1V7M9_9FUNG|nr:kinase-like protein [Piromyces finnis]|eukprot:ORX49267.1 kinase-like protein [Piromyces finnis]
MIGSIVKESNHLPTPRDEEKTQTKTIVLKGDKEQYIFGENNVIGRGAFGMIFKAKRKSDGTIVAIKKTKLDENYEHLVISNSTMREISLLASLKHKNMIKMLDFILPGENDEQFKNDIFVVMEYGHTDLEKLITKYYKNGLPEELIKDFLYQLLNGLTYCHDKGIIHRDLKPQNIILIKNNRNSFDLKITDFGIGRKISVPLGNYSYEVVTLFYRAPELLLNLPLYDQSIDIWSVGCIFAEMALGYSIFRGTLYSY